MRWYKRLNTRLKDNNRTTRGLEHGPTGKRLTSLGATRTTLGTAEEDTVLERLVLKDRSGHRTLSSSSAVSGKVSVSRQTPTHPGIFTSHLIHSGGTSV